MKKGKGFFGFARELVIFFLVAGIFVAFISLHNWDIIQAIEWLLTKSWEIISGIGNFFKGNEGFQKITTT